MIFVYIYIGFSLLTFLLVWTKTLSLTDRIKKEYKLDSVDNTSHIEWFEEALKIFAFSFIPIFHLLLFYSVLFYSDDIDIEVTEEVGRKLEEAGFEKDEN